MKHGIAERAREDHAGELGLVHVHDWGVPSPSIRKQEYKKREGEGCFTKVVNT